MKIVITGGHLTPAQAVIEELKKRGSWEIYYLGRKYSLEGQKIPSVESEIIPGLGVKFIPIPAGRLQRKFSYYTALSLLRIPFAFIYSLGLLVRIKPQVILSFGGYVSVPVVIAGWILRIPILIHEQTAISGLANQINAIFAKKILVSFPESLKHFSRQKAVLTGNPIRRAIFTCHMSRVTCHMSSEKLPLIYITGGNQGARIINRAVVEVLAELLQKYRIIHQCGKLDYKTLQATRNTLQTRLKNHYCLTDYVKPKDIGWVFNQADLVISRAGANIITELAALAKPAILIPLPWSYKNEQEKNAQMLVKAGSAVILPQAELSGEKLRTLIEEMINNLHKYQTSARQTKELVKLEAAKAIVNQIKYACKK